jgi:hypothetical protein
LIVLERLHKRSDIWRLVLVSGLVAG